MKCVKDALGRGRSVFLRGFGTFSLKKRAAKKAQNIQQHTTIFIPARKVPHFKPSDYSGIFNIHPFVRMRIVRQNKPIHTTDGMNFRLTISTIHYLEV